MVPEGIDRKAKTLLILLDIREVAFIGEAPPVGGSASTRRAADIPDGTTCASAGLAIVPAGCKKGFAIWALRGTGLFQPELPCFSVYLVAGHADPGLRDAASDLRKNHPGVQVNVNFTKVAHQD
jgi:hypothetical protein